MLRMWRSQGFSWSFADLDIIFRQQLSWLYLPAWWQEKKSEGTQAILGLWASLHSWYICTVMLHSPVFFGRANKERNLLGSGSSEPMEAIWLSFQSEAHAACKEVTKSVPRATPFLPSPGFRHHSHNVLQPLADWADQSLWLAICRGDFEIPGPGHLPSSCLRAQRPRRQSRLLV